MTPDQLAVMRASMHRMVDDLFAADSSTREAMAEGWGWPMLRITFVNRYDPAAGYVLVVGVQPEGEDDT